MSIVKDFVLGKAGDANAQTTSTNTNTNNISISVSSDQAGAQGQPVVGQPYLAPAPVNFTQNQVPTQPSQMKAEQATPSPYSNGSTTLQSGEVQYPSTFPQEAQVQVPEEVQQRIAALENDLEFYKLLSKILSDVLKTNNPKLIANVIDHSGKIIVDAVDLVRLIAIKTHTDPSAINLRYEDEEAGCFATVSPIKHIADIKINNVSFNLAFNAEYNILKDDYNISLSKVIIPLTYH